MTQITGKIYQMKNAEGTENRFPRTVIEGVLGLSSYLQNQFSSLADIYMPIGGIYQSKTGQEFVYRATPNTIKAKSFTLDRIIGRTDAWQQIATLNIRVWNVLTPYTWGQQSYSTNLVSTSDGVEIQPVREGETGADCMYVIENLNRKYYYSFGVLNTTSANLLCYMCVNAELTSTFTAVSGVINQRKGVITATEKRLVGINCAGITYGNGKLKIVKPVIVDLTLLYGSEISGMTDEQILAKFEREYPGYHDYSAGKLISNDAKQLETVGRNVWDEEWENGYWNVETGAAVAESRYIRSKNFIPALPDTEYFFNTPTIRVSKAIVIFYDSTGSIISYQEQILESTFTTPAYCASVKFYIKILDSGTAIYANDICINLSDESFNGQYEPYRKVVLRLNLDDFWVKDGQGNQVHITGGLKSAGSVHDEIVGNKYIKRVGSVDLGTLTWERYYGTNAAFRARMYSIQSGTRAESEYNMVCSKYATSSNQYHYDSLLNNSCVGSGTSDYFYIKDDSYSDESLFRDSLSGVYLDYELATPIEYDLAEPLIYTMKAGTTEARISPNEDGLSAPFCCDMTYSASDNNDADNAQYAATAGRLLNTHTILGQQFNGTQDIGGAISDVSSIDGAIHFDLTNPSSPLVGISTTTPTVRLDVNGNVRGSQLISTATGTLTSGTPPLTVASKTMVSNLNANYVGGKTLSEILASDITGNAATATKLQTGRNITISDGTHSGTSVSFDGSSAITLPLPTNLNVGTLDASGAITLSGAGSTNKRIYFSSNVYLELTSTGLHLNGAGLYSDSFITAYGTNESEALEALKAWVTENFEPKQS